MSSLPRQKRVAEFQQKELFLSVALMEKDDPTILTQ